MRRRGPGTTAVHGRREAPRGPLAAPIVQTSTFAFASAAEDADDLIADVEQALAAE